MHQCTNADANTCMRRPPAPACCLPRLLRSAAPRLSSAWLLPALRWAMKRVLPRLTASLAKVLPRVGRFAAPLIARLSR